MLEQGENDDAELEHMLQVAMHRREGSLVWHCVKALLESKLPRETCLKLLMRAWSKQTWQGVMCLLNARPHAARDVLHSAVEHAQWDLLDHCQIHGADINAKNDHGETFLQTAARRSQWKSVYELVSRDAEPDMADSEGFYPLYRACKARQWSTVDHLIQYQASLSVSDPFDTTPLMLIIQNGRAELIARALMWGKDLRGRTHAGETTLHAACRCGAASIMFCLIRRGVDPLAATDQGKTLLVDAVENRSSADFLVAQCIKLGLSTHLAPISA
jgi:ankyrin repeat protein